MTANESGLDRIVRVVLGVVLLAVAFLVASTLVLKILLIALGAIMFFTAATSFCPIYRIFNFSTKS